MKWSKSDILTSRGCTVDFDEEIRFNSEEIKKFNHLRGLDDVSVSGTIKYESTSDLATADIHVSGKMTLGCAITNEDVDYPFTTEGSETFAFHKIDRDSDIIEAKGDVIELMPSVFQLILMEIPLRVVKPGLKEYPKGDGWEVISEKDLIERKKKAVDPRMAKLADFKFEDDK